MEGGGPAPSVPSGGAGVGGAGEAGRGVTGGLPPMATVSTPAKDEVKTFNMEKFSGEAWASWSFRMELLFSHYGLLDVMDGSTARPESGGGKTEWDKRSKDGFFLLAQCLSSSQLHHVKHLMKDDQRGPKAWRLLKEVHAPSNKAMAVVLERQLQAVHVNEGDAVQGAFDQLRELYHKLGGAGVNYRQVLQGPLTAPGVVGAAGGQPQRPKGALDARVDSGSSAPRRVPAEGALRWWRRRLSLRHEGFQGPGPKEGEGQGKLWRGAVQGRQAWQQGREDVGREVLVLRR